MGNASFVRPEFERIYNENRKDLIKQNLLSEKLKKEILNLKSSILLSLSDGEYSE